MSGNRSDFETLIGPDRRRLPRPRGLAALVTAVAVAIVVGLILLWPIDTPEIDRSEIGFADEIVRAETVTAVVGPCSFDVEADCRHFQFTLLDEPVGDIAILEFIDELGQPTMAEGDV
ncbi:MAG TPA: hypothetical protein VF115_15615, partial [Acidimicrobiia bacterium]